MQGPARELVRKAAPRIVQSLLGSPSARAMVKGTFMESLDHQPHRVLDDLRPAAVRIERSHSPRGGDQTALTVWFGDGPALPGADGTPGRSRSGSVRLGAQIVGAIALSVATVLIGEWDRARRTQVIDAPVHGIGATGADSSTSQSAR